MLAGVLVVGGLVVWWLWFGDWLGISLIDAIGFISPSIAAWASIAVSNFDVLYFIFADAPLYGLLLVTGAVLLLGVQLARVIKAKRGRRD